MPRGPEKGRTGHELDTILSTTFPTFLPYLAGGTSVAGPYVDRLRDPPVSIVRCHWNVYVIVFYTVEREAAS